jgi:FecR protein
MPPLLRPIITVVGGIAVGLCLAAPPAVAEVPVGVGAAVNPQTVGTPPVGMPRPLVIGQPVIFNERIATTASGQAQIVFRDQSALSVGPFSDLVIDRFVYDPQTHSGRLAMSATRGVLRFVGGEIGRLDDGVTLATPAGSIGIRGGVFLAWLAPDGSTTAIFLYGAGLSVTGRGGAMTRVAYPGLAVTVDRSGIPSAPFVPPPGYVAALMAQFDGTAGPTVAAEEIQGRLAASPVLAQLDLADRLGWPPGPDFPPRNTPFDPVPFRSDFQVNSVAPQGDPRFLQAIRGGMQRSH